MIVETIEEIADVLGVSRRTIVDWQTEGMPVQERGKRGVGSKFDTAVCFRWMIQREIQKLKMMRPSDRLAIAQAEKIEMENDERRGILIVAAHIEPAMRAAVIAAREYWRNCQDDLADELKGEGDVDEIRRKLKRTFDGFEARMADWPNTQECEDALSEL